MMMIKLNTLTSYAIYSYIILVPLFSVTRSTGNCCLLISPATPLTEKVVGMRSYVTWKFSVEYYGHISPIPEQEFAILCHSFVLRNNREVPSVNSSSKILAYYGSRNSQSLIERKTIKSRHISIRDSASL